AANQNNQNAFIFELFYTTSDDKGQTWVMHNSIANGTFGSLDFVDRAWIDIDLQDNLYIAGVHFANSSIGDVGTIMWKKEATQGDFTPLGITAIPAVVNAPQFANLTMDANGVVHISASQISGTGNTPNDQVIYVRSNVGATSFGLPFSVATANTFPSNKVVHDRENGAISSAVDGDNVYLAWTDFEGSIKSYYVYSNDGGASFSSPVEIGVDFFGPDYYALMPVVAADDGHMAISWYKVDKTTQETEYVVANSNDFGSTLENVYSISDQLTDFSSSGTTFYGDYNSSTMKGDKVHMTWCDGRTGSPRVYYACIDFSQAVSTPEVSPINGGLELASIYPNPALENVSIALESQKAQMLRVEVLHISGKSCFQQTFSGKQGSNTFQLALDELLAGTYTVRVVSTDNYSVTRRLIKL
ncbi:MAG: T9SS type A sorting domain-containing protein, partial [Salibacteraceae bacterium]